MTRQILLRTLVVAVAFAAATAVTWWGIIVAAAIFGAITSRDRASAVVAGFGAIVAWGGLLIYDAIRGPAGTVAATLGGVLQVHPVAVYVLTLAFAGLLAVCSAVIARGLARAIAPAA
jgi:hypothetical protein